jgi:5-methylcytosine-specific restriction endonuclease McrA
MTYVEKLKSPEWQKKRLEILQRDKFTCTMCGSTEKQLHVHHKVYIYKNDPWDYENEFLTTLCLECHEEEEYSKYFVNRIIKFHIYKGLTYKELRPQISELMHKYVEIQDVTFDELQKFGEYV